MGASAQAQTLLVNFQADTYKGGSTWTDSQSGVIATASGTPVAGGSDITTTAGGFNFSTSSAGMVGLSTYAIAVGYTATSFGANGGGAWFQGQGIAGYDIPGGGQGDVGFSVTNNNGNGQLNSGAGVGGGAPGYNTDQIVDQANQTASSPVGAVFVVNSAANTLTLYVNGALVGTDNLTPGGFTVNQLGYHDGGAAPPSNPTLIDANFGIGVIGGGTNYLPGDITQFQVYSGSFTDAQAEALSTSIAASSVPEPSTYALMFLGLGGLALLVRRRSLV